MAAKLKNRKRPQPKTKKSLPRDPRKWTPAMKAFNNAVLADLDKLKAVKIEPLVLTLREETAIQKDAAKSIKSLLREHVEDLLDSLQVGDLAVEALHNLRRKIPRVCNAVELANDPTVESAKVGRVSLAIQRSAVRDVLAFIKSL